jgi:hypothetical protein
MDAAFDNSDDEEEDNGAGHHFPHAESSAATEPLLRGAHARTNSLARPQPGIYDFEYDYPPPPGSPTHGAITTTPAFGNSNGLLPLSNAVSRAPSPSLFERVSRRILPARFQQSSQRREVGGGNDGVFGNVVARSTANISRTHQSEPEMLSEDAQKEAPPSYEVAQQDAVPPYWETTIIAPRATADGELIIDGLPTGNIFSFMWNFLVSMSFQFVGFLLTYIMHTTHAAKYGSRAGLGITLVQYGFYLRSRTISDDDYTWGSSPSPSPSIAPSANATAMTSVVASNTTSISEIANAAASQDFTDSQSAAWISFFLMTIGWFILLSSVMGYWRVKRLEQGIRSSTAPAPPREMTSEEIAYDQQVLRNLDEAFGLGLGLPPRDEEEGGGASERSTPRRFNWGW